MAILFVTGRNATLAGGYTSKALYCGLTSGTAPALNTPATEISGGSYARVAVSWSAPASSVATPTIPAINVPAGVTITGMQYFDALTGGNPVDGFTLTSQAFATAGTYTPTGTQTAS